MGCQTASTQTQSSREWSGGIAASAGGIAASAGGMCWNCWAMNWRKMQGQLNMDACMSSDAHTGVVAVVRAPCATLAVWSRGLQLPGVHSENFSKAKCACELLFSKRNGR